VKILVVEDDASLNELVCAYVELAGFNARAALDGSTALRLARERPPALVMLDLMLPDIDGFEVCRNLKADPRTAAVPVVMLTAMTQESARRKGIECGAVAYLIKPFNPDELISTMRSRARKTG
jgi:two-component system phosphate regulon response regulator PhoB